MTLGALLQALVETTAFRLLPPLGYALFMRDSTPARRALAALSLAALTALAIVLALPLGRSLWAAAATAYVAASALVVHPVATGLRRGAITRPAIAVACVFGYLVLPGIALPAAAGVYFLVLGWEAALSAYSYAIEAARPGKPSSLSECCFFLVVSPLLIYAPAAAITAREPIPGRRSLGRVALGLLATAVAIPLAAPRALPFAQSLAELEGYAAFLANGVLVFAARYAALSGLASLQIGALRAIGFELPERYRYPFLARSPADFWQRWNSYVGEWLKRYVFMPVGQALNRSPRRGLRRLAGPLAIGATMLAIGLYHDAYVFSSELRPGLSATLAFAFAALAMIAWPVLARWSSRLNAGALGAVAAPLALLHAVSAMLWLFTRG